MSLSRQLALCLALLTTFSWAAPQVTNVTASQRDGTKLVDIGYTLTSDADARILVRVSTDGGATYEIIPSAGSLSGDVGSQVPAGAEKLIVWDMRQDYDWQFNENMRVKIIAETGAGADSEPPNLSMATIAGGGMTLGRVQVDEDDGDTDEVPAGNVTVGAFEISTLEITNEQYAEYLRAALAAGEIQLISSSAVALSGPFVGETLYNGQSDPRRITNDGSTFEIEAGYAQHPAINVTWYGAVSFCQFYTTNDVQYDLPTEAEWEFAARGPGALLTGAHDVYPFATDGSVEDMSNKANFLNSGDLFDDQQYATTPVGNYNGLQVPSGDDQANSNGLYDVVGNVREWCRSGYNEYPYPALDSTTHQVNSLSHPWQARVIRGGSWAGDVLDLRLAGREGNHPSSFSPDLGFRIVRRSLNAR